MQLPTADGTVWLTDSGLETDLIFHRGVELAEFAAFPLLETADGRRVLRGYYRDHIDIAVEHGLSFVLEAPTWRANPDWGRALGYDRFALDRVNEQAVAFLSEVAATDAAGVVSVISGCIGPRADAYRPARLMSADEAADYHRPQIAAFARAGADLVNAMTIAYSDEAVGIVRGAAESRLPVTISFTVETDGRLPDGSTLADAIGAVDAATGSVVAHFSVNCAHPDHIAAGLRESGEWTARLRGLRANASRRSHAELDEAADLDDGDPAEFAAGYGDLRSMLPGLMLLGGCCGSDARHVAAVAAAL